MHAGLDLGRNSIAVALVTDGGEVIDEFSVRPTGPGLGALVDRFGRSQTVRGVVESMSGARFVYDFLTDAGWEMQMADAYRVKGIGSLAAKTDRIDARVLAELSRRDLVPAVWIPPQGVRAERERARFRRHLIKHRTGLKNRIHSGLIAHGQPCRVSDLFGKTGRRTLDTLDFDEPWSYDVAACLQLIDHLDDQVKQVDIEIRRLGVDHRYVPLLKTAPGVGDILGYTIAAEIGDIGRFSSAKKLVGYTGLAPRVHQSGQQDRRGPLTRNGPKHLRWALVEAAIWASRHPAYAAHYQKTKQRLGKQRGNKVARVEVARKLATAIYWMLTRNQPFNPGGPTKPLVA